MHQGEPQRVVERGHGSSLHARLWLIITLAVAPVFLVAVFDYQSRREEAVAMIERDIGRMLVSARQEENRALEQVRLALQIMASSDDLADLNPEDCSGIAQRLLGTIPDFVNLGAALPDGFIFCSAHPAARAVDVRDRAWFMAALGGEGLSRGEYVVGRISGRPGVVFSYPLRDLGGQLRAALFASIQLDWFDRLLASYALPEGWEASLMRANGEVIAHYPNAERMRNEGVGGEMRGQLIEIARSGRHMGELVGFDGERRVFGVERASLLDDDLFVVIGAPIERTLSRIDRVFWAHILVLLLIALVSALVARFNVYRLIELWALQMREAVVRIAAGDLSTRISNVSPVRELAALERGINAMAAELGRRDAELRRLSMAVEQSPECIVITNTKAQIEYVNEAFQRTTGYSREEVLGRNPNILNAGLTPKATYEAMWAALAAGEVWRGEFHNTRKDGSTYLEFATVAPIRQPDGTVTHYVAVKEDITLRKASEERIHRLAYYDSLTELPNRTLLRDRLRQATLGSERSQQHGLLLLLDIDHFKQLNDTRGHAAGDVLLRTLAQRLRACVREEDTVARMGDDDFAVLIEDTGAEQAEALAHAELVAHKLHQALSAPCDLGGRSGLYHAAVSIGVTLFQGKDENTEELLKQAEVALQQAKQDGRNAIRFFNPAMQAAVDARAAMELGLRDALSHNAFELYYQPQVDGAGQVVGAEALIRWLNAGGIQISPAAFIPLAEDTGLIVPIGYWVLETACAQLASWQAQPETRHLSLAVNVSAKQFHQPDFVAQVRARLEHSGVDSRGLKLELTESVILGDLEETITRMNQLREMGVRFALDDFGTGYSSLSYLKRLPFDQLKIDQSFVRDMVSDRGSDAIVRAILAMSSSLGLEVIAEGVETAQQYAYLRANGCMRYQGYLFGRPLPITAWPMARG